MSVGGCGRNARWHGQAANASIVDPIDIQPDGLHLEFIKVSMLFGLRREFSFLQRVEQYPHYKIKGLAECNKNNFYANIYSFYFGKL